MLSPQLHHPDLVIDAAEAPVARAWMVGVSTLLIRLLRTEFEGNSSWQ